LAFVYSWAAFFAARNRVITIVAVAIVALELVAVLALILGRL